MTEMYMFKITSLFRGMFLGKFRKSEFFGGCKLCMFFGFTVLYRELWWIEAFSILNSHH